MEKFLSSWSYFLSISWNSLTRLLSTLSQNFFHSGFFPLHPFLLIPLDEEEEPLFCQFGEKHGFLMVLGGGIQRRGGDGDSCLMGVGPEYLGLLRHWSSSWWGHIKQQ